MRLISLFILQLLIAISLAAQRTLAYEIVIEEDTICLFSDYPEHHEGLRSWVDEFVSTFNLEGQEIKKRYNVGNRHAEKFFGEVIAVDMSAHRADIIDLQFQLDDITVDIQSPKDYHIYDYDGAFQLYDLNDLIYKVVEDQPRFPGCEEMDLEGEELRDCSQEKLMQYIQDMMIYPESAKQAGIQGMVAVRFIVNQEGRLSNFEILRSIHPDCDQEALRIVQSMNNLNEPWTPGYQRGKPVKVQYNLPVRFSLH